MWGHETEVSACGSLCAFEMSAEDRCRMKQGVQIESRKNVQEFLQN